MATNPENGPPIHDPAYWDAFDATFDAQLEPFRGIPPEQFTDGQWRNLAMFAIQQVADLHYLVRAIALDANVTPPEPVAPSEPPKRAPRSRRAKPATAEDAAAE